METPQHFCNGALVGNLATPNNQIVWYKAGESTPLLPTDKLEAVFYEAVQTAGDCESPRSLPVEVILDKYPGPVTVEAQCYKSGTLADLIITGAGVKWYAAEFGGPALPLTTPANSGNIFWASQSAGTCESLRTKVTIASVCYEPFGTVFPFVYTGDDDYDEMFVTTAKLYALPPSNILDKMGYIRKQTPLQTVQVTYYDCNIDDIMVGAPLNPGIIGSINNPGLPIQWNQLGYTPTGADPAVLSLSEPCPSDPIGKYKFEEIAPGEYVIEISRKGFLTRYGVIEVSGDDYLGHREILGGDVNGDATINAKDVTTTTPKITLYKTPLYNAIYDIIGDKRVSTGDISVIQVNLGAFSTIYLETENFTH
jgi:hypothetical protein